MKNTCSTSVLFGEPIPTVTAAVAALAQPQLDRLRLIAQRRLERLKRSTACQRLIAQFDPADFVQDAVTLVLVGEWQPGQGRHTNPRHLASAKAFFNFLQGIMHSRISLQLKKAVQEDEHVADSLNEPVLSRTVTQDVQLNEIRSLLGERLRAAAGSNPALQATLSLLELESEADLLEPSRKQLCRMRKLGRQTLQNLAGGEPVRDLLLA